MYSLNMGYTRTPKVIVMAGGKGTRLQPFTASFPKPLMPLGDMPIIEILLRQLKAAGFEEVILAVNHLHYLIHSFCGDGSRFGLTIDYELEEKPLGTAGAIAALLHRVGDNFIVINGDILTNFDIPSMVEEHLSLQPTASVAVHERQLKIDFGVVETDVALRMMGYREKPIFPLLVSMGIYVLDRALISKQLKSSVHLDMPDLLMALVNEGHNVHCVKQGCEWLDIGRPEDYAIAQQLFAERRELFVKD
jgi:NDP-mannose synthase